MADTSMGPLRPKTKHNLGKERYRDKKTSSRHDKYDDNRYSSSHNHLSRDHEPNHHDRSHRNTHDSIRSRSQEDRHSRHKSEEIQEWTLPHTSRYNEEKLESRNSRTRDHPNRDETRVCERSSGFENRENVSSSNRLVKTHERNPRTNDEEYVSSLIQRIDHLNNQIAFLSQENEKLKYAGNGSSAFMQDPNAEVNIIFKDKYLEKKFLPSLEELVYELIMGNVNIEEVQKLCSRAEVITKSPEPPEGDLFAVDNSTLEPCDEFTQVPRYDTSFSEVLQKDEEVIENDKKTPRLQKGCFNCQGNHHMKDCPEKINYNKVARAKKQMFNSQPPKGRYHCLQNAGSEFKPGAISKELMRAMDLEPDQIPSYIYRMRVLDYPPGWLQEATVENSGISLYGVDGKSQKDNLEERGDDDITPVQYDASKFIDYPGFNIPLPPNIVEECHEWGMPQMQPHQLRSYVEQHVPTKVFLPKRKRKLSDPDVKPTKTQRVEEDMEIASDSDSSEFIPPLPEEEDPPPPPPDLLVLSDAEENSGLDTPLSDTLRQTLAERLQQEDSSAPSLRDLEEIKKQLVLELGMASGSSSPAVLEDYSEESMKGNGNDTSCEGSPQVLRRTDSQCSSKSKLVMLGTPSVSRHSSFRKLPEYEKFSKDVSTHMVFENLPNSTGAYQKMKRVLKKVKSKISSMIND